MHQSLLGTSAEFKACVYIHSKNCLNRTQLLKLLSMPNGGSHKQYCKVYSCVLYNAPRNTMCYPNGIHKYDMHLVLIKKIFRWSPTYFQCIIVSTYWRMWHNSCKFNMQMGSKPVCGLQMIQQFFTWPATKCVTLHFITVNEQIKHTKLVDNSDETWGAPFQHGITWAMNFMEQRS
jgi:hypothetical protein